MGEVKIMAEGDSALLAKLKDTFEPANVEWLKTECCRRCRHTTLKVPKFSTDGKLMMMGCPECQYVNIEDVPRAIVRKTT
jgi:hypothetical protein